MIMPNKPLISIITVVYNSVNFLEGSIKSIALQDSKNFEHIIVDGGSTDGTLELIHRYENQIHQWISEPDKGLYDAMNKGIRMARGEYIWFINSGDKLYENQTISKIEVIVELNSMPDIVYGETVIIDENDIEIGLRRLKTPQNLSVKSLFNGLVVCHQSFIIKRNIASEYNLKYKIAADYDWVLKALKSSKTIVNSNLILSRYLDNGFSKNNIPKALKERFGIMAKEFGWFKTALKHIVIGTRFFTYFLKNRRF